MIKREKKFYIMIFILFFLFAASITIKDGFLYYPLFEMSRTDSEMVSYSLREFNELRTHMIKGAFKPQLTFETIKDILVLPIILLTLIVATMQINLKNRYYVYLVGREKKFFKKYIADGLKKMITTTFTVHMAVSLWSLEGCFKRAFNSRRCDYYKVCI